MPASKRTYITISTTQDANGLRYFATASVDAEPEDGTDTACGAMDALSTALRNLADEIEANVLEDAKRLHRPGDACGPGIRDEPRRH